MPLLLTVLSVAYGLMTVILVANLWHLRRHRRVPPLPTFPSLSVIIPARNEADNLRRLLPSLLRQDYPDLEVVVYDDGSEDETAAVARGTADPRVVVLEGSGPPPGWIGKVHALYQATRRARGDRYLFLDADARLRHQRALRRLVARHDALPEPVAMTGLPLFEGGGQLLVSAVGYALLVTLPLPLVPKVRRAFMGALNGQCWMIRRELYHRLEPHAAHPDEVLEDVRIGQWLRARGVVTWFADLKDDVAVRMYRSFGTAWDGFRKNTYLLLGGRPLPFLLWWGWFLGVLVLAPLAKPILYAPLILTKIAADRAGGQRILVSLAAPVTFALWSLLQLDSAVHHLSGRVRWKGRPVAGGS